MLERPLSEIAILSGAGVSTEAPASVPLASAIRTQILNGLLIRAAPVADLESTIGPYIVGRPWRLEYVLGRLLRTLPADAADRLAEAFEVPLPNRTHLLLAAHLVAGGVQATLNYDDGIDQAFRLLATSVDPPPGPDAAVASSLRAWREFVGPVGARLAAIGNDRAFVEWRNAPTYPALFKVHQGANTRGHGRIPRSGLVLSDDDQLGGLPADRAFVVPLLGSRELIITGYAGDDLDLFEPLLSILRRDHFLWATRTGLKDSPIRSEIAAIDPTQPMRFEAEALLERLLPGAPSWPRSEVDPDRFAIRLDAWIQAIPHESAAEALASMLVDARLYDPAVEVLERLSEKRSVRVAQRLADALYHRALGSDRGRAARLYATSALWI